MAVDIPAFAQTQLSLLAAELAEEIAESSALVAGRMCYTQTIQRCPSLPFTTLAHALCNESPKQTTNFPTPNLISTTTTGATN